MVKEVFCVCLGLVLFMVVFLFVCLVFLICIIFHLLTAEHGQWERLQEPLLSMVAPDALMRGRIISLKKRREVRMSLPYPEDVL